MFSNQEEIYIKLVNDVSAFNSDKVIMLLGKAGIGKSFVIDKLMQEISGKYSCPICYIKGDQFCQDRDYYCIKRALTQLITTYDKKKNLVDSIAKLGKAAPYIGELQEKIISDKLNQKEIYQKRRNFFLNEDEQNIVYRLNYLFDKRRSLIICDNIQFFDKKSLELLHLFFSTDESFFDFLAECQFIIIYTETSEKMDPILQNVFSSPETVKHKMNPINYEDMDTILEKFGVKEKIDDKIKRILYKLSDGHLEVIKQIALQMNDQDQFFDLEIKEFQSEGILEKLIEDKLTNLGASGAQISQLLEYASLIGSTFSNYELETITELNKQEFINAIKRSNDMELIVTQKNFSNFSHDIIQLLFRNRANTNIILYYERMRACIKELYPSEYKRRIEIEFQLGNMRNAAILIVLLYAKQNYELPIENTNYLQILSLNPDIKDFFDNIQLAFEKYTQKDYEKAISILDSIGEFLPIELLAERDILKSVSLTKLLNEKYRQQAISCLEEYSLENLNSEGDLYLRVMLTLISSYSHVAEIEKAKKCEKKIWNYLQPRLNYDDNASTIMNILRRKANSMHECIYAEKYIRDSVKYFSPLPNQSASLNPIQYLMSLVNHAGILIECSHFAEALGEISKAQELVKGNIHIAFPRLHIVDNNYLIAIYLSDERSKANVLSAYKKIVDLNQNADNIFIISNYSALLAVNGYIEEAYQILLEKSSNLPQNREQFYELCINNNLLVLELFRQQFDSAQKRLDELSTHIDGIIDESYYRKKYQLFQQVINEQMCIPFEKIDTFLFDLCKNYQEAWKYWGRSFDYTSLYYWSDV